MIDYAVITPLLNSLTDVTAMIASRIYPLVLPTDPILPAITFQVIGGVAKPPFDTAGLRKYRVQFDCWALTYMAASDLRAALVADLDGYAGSVTLSATDGFGLGFGNSFGGASSSVTIQDCQFIQPIDRFNADMLQYICSAEFYIFTTA